MIPDDAADRLDRDAVDYAWLEALTDLVEAGAHAEAEGAACARALDGFVGRTDDDELIEAGLNCLHSVLNTLSGPVELPGVLARLDALAPDALEQAVNCLGSSGQTAYRAQLSALLDHRDRGVASAARIGLTELGDSAWTRTP